MEILRFLVGLLSVKSDKVPSEGVELITPLSYLALPDRLTTGTEKAMRIATRFKAQMPGATLAFSNPAHAGFEGSEGIEYAHKLVLLGAIPHTAAKTCTNSVSEAEAIRDVLSVTPQTILIVCGEIHARTARKIWKKVFPTSRVFVATFPFEFEHEVDHPVTLERWPWRWLMVSLVREALFLVLGLKLRSLTHHTANKSG